MGFGVLHVNGRNLVPSPPTRITAFINSPQIGESKHLHEWLDSGSWILRGATWIKNLHPVANIREYHQGFVREEFVVPILYVYGRVDYRI
jgi:hypothetical protein